jgi:hypothetical protein
MRIVPLALVKWLWIRTNRLITRFSTRKLSDLLNRLVGFAFALVIRWLTQSQMILTIGVVTYLTVIWTLFTGSLVDVIHTSVHHSTVSAATAWDLISGRFHWSPRFVSSDCQIWMGLAPTWGTISYLGKTYNWSWIIVDWGVDHPPACWKAGFYVWGKLCRSAHFAWLPPGGVCKSGWSWVDSIYVIHWVWLLGP